MIVMLRRDPYATRPKNLSFPYETFGLPIHDNIRIQLRGLFLSDRNPLGSLEDAVDGRRRGAYTTRPRGQHGFIYFVFFVRPFDRMLNVFKTHRVVSVISH